MTDFDSIDRRIRKTPQCRFGDGASDADIARAESQLGVEIRGGYREFLRRFGWMYIAEDEELEPFIVCGLGGAEEADVVRFTMTERTEMSPALPTTLIAVHDTHAGDRFCLDTSTNSGGEPSVVLFTHDGKIFPLAPEEEDFASWLKMFLDLALGP